MQDLIKRYFWILGGITVMVCAVFAAKATAHIVEAKFLGDPDHGPKLAVVAPRADAPQPDAGRCLHRPGAPLASFGAPTPERCIR